MRNIVYKPLRELEEILDVKIHPESKIGDWLYETIKPTSDNKPTIDKLKKEFSKILGDVVRGKKIKWRYKNESGSHIRWGLIEEEVHKLFDRLA